MSNALDRAARQVEKRSGLVRRSGTSFAGAANNRLLADWSKWVMSPTLELKYELTQLRARSRDLCKNNPHGRRFLAAVAENVIGHKGIRLQARNLLPDGERDRPNNARIEQGWRDFGRYGVCTVDRHHTWIGAQQLGAKLMAMDGEVFWRDVAGYDNAHGFAIQFIDPDLIDETFSVPSRGPANEIVMGVEIDEWGAEVAYWMWTQYSSDNTGRLRERIRVPATEMHHLFVQRRPNQYRGDPWLAPVMVPMQHTGGYVEAEIVAARASAAKMGFIIPGEDNGEDESEQPDEEKFFEAAAGIVERLKHGDTFAEWDPQHPTGAFESFIAAMARMTAAGLNMGPTTLTGDYTRTNYSSHRGEKLVERDGWRVLQGFFAEGFNEAVFLKWLPIARLAGALDLPGKTQQWLAHDWRPRGWPWVDPLRDLEANGTALAMQLTSRTRLCAEEGEDFEEILAELAEEKDLAASYGVELSDPATTFIGVPDNDDDEEGDPDEAGDPIPADDAGKGRPRKALGGRRARAHLHLQRGALPAVVRQ